MKKARVIVKTTVSIHQIYVEHNGERTLYAVTDKVAKAKDLVLEAKRELGIASPSYSPEGAREAGERGVKR